MVARKRARKAGQAAFALLLVMLPSAAWAWPPAIAERPEGSRAQITATFPAPEELEPAIRFWSDIFARHSSQHVVIHDLEDFDVIWQVLVLPADDDGVVNPATARKSVKAATDALRTRLKRLEKSPKPIDDEDHTLLTLLGGANSPRLKGAWRRIRAQRGIADNIALGMERSKQWLPAIKKILREEGVPEQLAALPFIESSFNPLARSVAGASGLWQLMPGTARQYGLKVTRQHDDRNNVLLATRAAAQLLADNYRMLGAWPLAITGYNHGPYGLKRAVHSVGSTDIVYLIKNYERSTWGFASKNFYAEFLAVLRVLEAAEMSAFTTTTTATDTEAGAHAEVAAQ